VTSSFDRISGNLITPSSQPYSRFRIQTNGANIIQGQVNKLSITELSFPYDIPTVVKGQNDSLIIYDYEYVVGQPIPVNPPAVYVLTFPQGFYTATEAVAVLNGLFPLLGLGLSLSAAVSPSIGAISIRNTSTWNATPGASNHIYELLPYSTSGNYDATNFYNTPQLLWTLGFRSLYASYPFQTSVQPTNVNPHAISLVPISSPPTLSLNFPTLLATKIEGTPYSGAYTNYIDIVSPALTQAQYVRDSTTSQNTVKKDVIARIYVNDNVSLATSNSIGSRPFVIYRLYPCPKVMKWTVDRSLDAISLELYDQYGLPLPDVGPLIISSAGTTQVFSGPRDYAITFHVHEHDETMEPNVGYRY
jgi:hypothetical protein